MGKDQNLSPRGDGIRWPLRAARAPDRWCLSGYGATFRAPDGSLRRQSEPRGVLIVLAGFSQIPARGRRPGRTRGPPDTQSWGLARRTPIVHEYPRAETNFGLGTFRFSRLFLVSKFYPINLGNFPN